MKGFTLIEIIAVLIILSIVGVFAATRLTSSAAYNLIAQGDVIKNHIRYAQGRAMNSDVVWGIHISSPSTYALFTNGNVNNRVPLPGENSNVVTLPAGMTLTTGIVSFDTWGRPCTDGGGQVLQTGSRILALTYGGQSVNITITEDTGFVP